MRDIGLAGAPAPSDIAASQWGMMMGWVVGFLGVALAIFEAWAVRNALAAVAWQRRKETKELEDRVYQLELTLDRITKPRF